MEFNKNVAALQKLTAEKEELGADAVDGEPAEHCRGLLSSPENTQPNLVDGDEMEAVRLSGTGAGTQNRDEEELIKELKKIRRQNTITHCLLASLIAVTLAWQLSEVSMVLQLKNVVSHPLKSIGGGIIKKFLPKTSGEQEASAIPPPSSSFPGLKIPNLPLPGLDDSDEDDDD